MKNAVTVVLVILFSSVVFYLFCAKIRQEKTDLEIYTKDNIYYINGLQVTNEVSNDTLNFDNQNQLKEYISNLTFNLAKEN